jgi:hypothetical protein
MAPLRAGRTGESDATTAAQTSGAIISLTSDGAARAALDFEVSPSFVLTISVSDGLGLSTQANVTVSLNNRTEPPIFNTVYLPQPGASLACMASMTSDVMSTACPVAPTVGGARSPSTP